VYAAYRVSVTSIALLLTNLKNRNRSRS